MKRFLFVLTILIGFGLLAGCQPDPRKAAEAYEIEMRANVTATAAAQVLDVKTANDALDIEIREARKADVIETWRIFIKLVGLAATAACFYVVFYLGRAGATVATGLAGATVAAAELKALQVHLDQNTRTYPLLMRPIHNGRFLVHDPNTGSSTVLDMNNPVDRQLIATSGAVRLAGAVAQEARQHDTDPAGVSVVANVPVIGAAYAMERSVVDVEVENG